MYSTYVVYRILLIHVPLLLGRPKPANHEAPRRNIVGVTAIVSTLVTVVGHPNKPMFAGKGGFKRGLP